MFGVIFDDHKWTYLCDNLRKKYTVSSVILNRKFTDLILAKPENNAIVYLRLFTSRPNHDWFGLQYKL